MASNIRVIKRLSSIAVVTICLSLVIAAAAVAAIPQIVSLSGIVESERAPIEMRPLAIRSSIYSSDGELVTFLSEEENRQIIDLENIPQDVITTILASEDANFYEHNGISLRGMARAGLKDLIEGGIAEGGSTITQQLIKNAVLSAEQSGERKGQEILLAMQLETEWTKDQILERYLNTVYFGSGAYGVEAAAETYWGYEGAEDLTMCDATLLAAMIPNPTQYDPTRFQDEARNRRSVVINRLLSVGKMTDTEAEDCRTSPLPVQRQKPVDTQPTNYFTEEVLQLLLKDPTFLGGESQQERFDMVYEQGLKIFTTLDPVAQAAAEEAQENFVPRNAEGYTAALVSVDSHTGAVRAVVGGPGFREEKFNIATQGAQQPGSTMKTFVLAALFESGYVPTDTVRADSPCTFRTPGGENYTVRSAGGSGRQTIASVTRSSYNCPFLRLGQVIGNDTVIDTTRRLGISNIPDEAAAFVSLPLGVLDLIPLEVAGAYASFPNDGEFNKPWFIERIEDAQGNTIYEHEPNPSKAISANSARLITEILRQNVTREAGNGTGRRAQVVLEDGTEHVVAGKTGTTNDNVSAWFAGYTDYLTTVVWVGHPDGNLTVNPASLNRDAYNVPEYCCISRAEGGLAAAPIFDYYMEIVHEGLEPRPFAQAENLQGRRSQFLQTAEEITRFCDGVIEGQEAPIPGQSVDLDGDGINDCLVPRSVPEPEGPVIEEPPVDGGVGAPPTVPATTTATTSPTTGATPAPTAAPTTAAPTTPAPTTIPPAGPTLLVTAPAPTIVPSSASTLPPLLFEPLVPFGVE